MAEEIEPRSEPPPPGRRHMLVDRLIDRLGSAGHVKTAFGDPVERAGVTVIPVARVRYGFGGGQGGDDAAGGAGAGGGVQVSPVGYIEMKDGAASYRPIRDLTAIAPLIVASGFASLLLLTGVSRLIPARSRDRHGSRRAAAADHAAPDPSP